MFCCSLIMVFWVEREIFIPMNKILKTGYFTRIKSLNKKMNKGIQKYCQLLELYNSLLQAMQIGRQSWQIIIRVYHFVGAISNELPANLMLIKLGFKGIGLSCGLKVTSQEVHISTQISLCKLIIDGCSD